MGGMLWRVQGKKWEGRMQVRHLEKERGKERGLGRANLQPQGTSTESQQTNGRPQVTVTCWRSPASLKGGCLRQCPRPAQSQGTQPRNNVNTVEGPERQPPRFSVSYAPRSRDPWGPFPPPLFSRGRCSEKSTAMTPPGNRTQGKCWLVSPSSGRHQGQSA